MPKALTKVCSMCKKEKPWSEFYHNRTKGDKHNSICKDCQRLSNATNKAKRTLPNF